MKVAVEIPGVSLASDMIGKERLRLENKGG